MHVAFKGPKLTVEEICNKIIALSFFRNTIRTYPLPRGGGGGGVGNTKKILWGCAARFLRTLPYFRPKAVIFPTLFQTCFVISSLGQTNVKGNVYTLLLTRIQNCTKFRA